MPTRTTIKTQIHTKIYDAKTIRSGVMKLGISDLNMPYVCRKKGIPKQEPRFVEARQFKNFTVGEFQYDLLKAFRYLRYIQIRIMHCMTHSEASPTHLEILQLLCKFKSLFIALEMDSLYGL